jgi:hypothetical protein
MMPDPSRYADLLRESFAELETAVNKTEKKQARKKRTTRKPN